LLRSITQEDKINKTDPLHDRITRESDNDLFAELGLRLGQFQTQFEAENEKINRLGGKLNECKKLKSEFYENSLQVQEAEAKTYPDYQQSTSAEINT
jgi:hypothetical protein